MPASGERKVYNQYIGDSVFARVRTPGEYTRFLKENLLDSDPLIVKADWVSTEENSPRNLEALRCIAEAVKGKVIVTEGHQLWRSRILVPSGLKFTVDGKEVDWNWLLDGKGWTWLIRQRADWRFFTEGPHWSHIMKEEQAFLNKHGFTDFFKENGIEYLNVSDEIWAGRVVDPKNVKEAVEAKYGPVFTDKLYGVVPEKLYRHRGSSLVSLSKRKDYQSFTMKNNFGLIPDPVRAWWHGFKEKDVNGPNGKRLAKSVLDINKVYGAFFDLVGVFEAPRGDWSTFTRDVGISRSMAQLDAILNHLAGFEPANAAYLSAGNGVFGSYTPELLRESEAKLEGWFPAPKST